MVDTSSTRRRFLGVAAGSLGLGTSTDSVSGRKTYSRSPRVEQQASADATTGHVVLTFDHAAPSVYDTAFPILREFGYPALLAVVADRIGRTRGRLLGIDQLRELRSAGWEIGSHSMSDHPDFASLSAEELQSQCRKSKRWLLDHGFAAEAASIVYPMESATERVADVAREHFAVGFGGPHEYGTAIADPLLIGRVNGDDVEATTEAIDAAAADEQVLAVMYHTVGADDGRISASAFRETMAHVQSKGNALRVITPSTLARLLAGEPIEPSAGRAANANATTPSATATNTRTTTETDAPSTSATETSPTTTETDTTTRIDTKTDTPTTVGTDTPVVTSRSTETDATGTAVDGPGFGAFAAFSGLAGWTAYRLTRETDE